ncbi:monooxygenase [Kineococcus sp. SYSU DK006]|uniref:monooxygenase n=1 Tax=Kineococcus sp. SYSU DK006 TaxID=3383127 RepID=UPI003D7D8643
MPTDPPRSPGAPALVTLDVWTVPPRRVAGALWRMAADRPALARTPGARFSKLMGTGSGRTFTVRDADPRRWALLVAWAEADDADRFERSATVQAWRRLAAERLQVRLAPLTSRGRWSGAEPFGGRRRDAHEGPVASITRARLHPARAASFWRSVPPVSQQLHGVPGLRCALGIGEAPLGYQGTFSLWESTDALRAFAHRTSAHRDVVRRTPREGWYAEELFARFAVLDVRGTLDGRTP